MTTEAPDLSRLETQPVPASTDPDGVEPSAPPPSTPPSPLEPSQAVGDALSLVLPEPPPLAAGGPACWDLVLEDMRARDAEGRRRYGNPLRPWNGRRALVDAYQELLDLVVYLRQELAERADLEARCSAAEAARAAAESRRAILDIEWADLDSYRSRLEAQMAHLGEQQDELLDQVEHATDDSTAAMTRASVAELELRRAARRAPDAPPVLERTQLEDAVEALREAARSLETAATWNRERGGLGSLRTWARSRSDVAHRALKELGHG